MVHTRGGKHLVIAFFKTPAAGKVAARVLAKEASAAGRPGTVGLLMLDAAGKIQATKLGDPASAEGPGVGPVLAMIAMALSGSVMPKRGHFFDTESDLSTDDVARFGVELEAGQALVAVLEVEEQADRVVVRLARLGAKTEVHGLTGRALRQAASATTTAHP